MTFGTLGFRLSDLAFVAALLAMVAFAVAAHRTEGTAARRRWLAIGRITFLTHVVSVLGVIALIWGLIFTQQYQYHYVYSHSSNELPTQFIIACLWEGQEGSFLIWTLWHGILGTILLFTAGSWRAPVLAVVASVQAILSSMILGVVVTDTVAVWLVGALALGLIFVLLRPLFVAHTALPTIGGGTPWGKLARIGAGLAGLLVLLAVVSGRSGEWLATGWTTTLGGWVAAVLLLGIALLLVQAFRQRQLSFVHAALAFLLLGLGYVLSSISLDTFKIGSSPFLTLAEARPQDEFLQANPDFIPANGTGLNALLQNYWMVIHPPTLFLGFAATLIPFAFVVAALWQRRYREWIGPASPWAIFALAILGLGIMMGGYWAYETLNFGGYWNWDPVENASLVPWLLGVGGLHAMLSYRKSGKNLMMSMLLMAATFVLVLYSTFLTRSGILGETSVHSFTDLGLSGQLLLLLFFYLGGIVLLFAWRWKQMPQEGKATTLYSREFFLFLAAAILTFTAIEISLVTSMPVINKIFGTRMAPPGDVQFFFYRWNVWFAIAIAALSAIGQFFYWTKIEKETLLRAMFRPFLAAAISTAVVMVLIFLVKWEFAYLDRFEQTIMAAKQGSWWQQFTTYISTGLLAFADDLLLFCSLFTVLANANIIWRLVRRRGKNLRHAGGSLAHIGFGLMMLGILFSSGYEDTLSVNLNPDKLSSSFGDEAARENVVLPLHQTVDIKQYRLVYRGRKPAVPPFTDFRVVTITRDVAKVAFRDADDFRFAIEIPSKLFSEHANYHSTGQVNPRDLKAEQFNTAKIAWYISKQHKLLDPQMINGRALYAVDFYPVHKNDVGATVVDSLGAFRLYPEAEANGDQSLIPHPDKALFVHRDIYAHVTGFPTGMEPTDDRWTVVLPETAVALDSSFTIDGVQISPQKVERIPVPDGLGDSELLTQLELRVTRGDSTWRVAPQLMINRQTGGIVWLDAFVPELNYRIRFSGVDVQADKFKIMVAEHIPIKDYIILNVISKPWINLLWLGTLVMLLGFGVAIWRRVGELSRKA